MNGKRALTLALLVVLLSSAGCAYRYYLGMRGPSIGNSPDIHTASIKEDGQCLECHAPKDASGDAPLTSHPGFKGCLKCHDDAGK
jgi:predicted CXXCH cytochrome family protein